MNINFPALMQLAKSVNPFTESTEQTNDTFDYCLVIAHPDDELITFGPMFDKVQTIICVTDPKDGRKEICNSICVENKIRFICLDAHDTGLGSSILSQGLLLQMYTALKGLGSKYLRIFTHCPLTGDLGAHQHHKETAMMAGIAASLLGLEIHYLWFKGIPLRTSQNIVFYQDGRNLAKHTELLNRYGDIHQQVAYNLSNHTDNLRFYNLLGYAVSNYPVPKVLSMSTAGGFNLDENKEEFKSNKVIPWNHRIPEIFYLTAAHVAMSANNADLSIFRPNTDFYGTRPFHRNTSNYGFKTQKREKLTDLLVEALLKLHVIQAWKPGTLHSPSFVDLGTGTGYTTAMLFNKLGKKLGWQPFRGKVKVFVYDPYSAPEATSDYVTFVPISESELQRLINLFPCPIVTALQTLAFTPGLEEMVAKNSGVLATDQWFGHNGTFNGWRMAMDPSTLTIQRHVFSGLVNTRSLLYPMLENLVITVGERASTAIIL